MGQLSSFPTKVDLKTFHDIFPIHALICLVLKVRWKTSQVKRAKSEAQHYVSVNKRYVNNGEDAFNQLHLLAIISPVFGQPPQC